MTNDYAEHKVFLHTFSFFVVMKSLYMTLYFIC